jgi:hypothetical protein
MGIKSLAETALAPLIVPYGSQKVYLSQGIPVYLSEVKL